jgi:hypothetical protein
MPEYFATAFGDSNSQPFDLKLVRVGQMDLAACEAVASTPGAGRPVEPNVDTGAERGQ